MTEEKMKFCPTGGMLNMAKENRLIDANDVYALFDVNGFARLHVGDIDIIPRVDAVEVVHGRWDIDRSFMPFLSTCSECGAFYDVDGAFEWNYCPNCGAKMILAGK